MSDLLRVWDVKKTRKECKCFGCNRKVPVGSSVKKEKVVDDGYFHTFTWCAVCTEYEARYPRERDDYIMCGDLCNDVEGWEDVRREIEGS
jgi:hypothetical protein